MISFLASYPMWEYRLLIVLSWAWTLHKSCQKNMPHFRWLKSNNCCNSPWIASGNPSCFVKPSRGTRQASGRDAELETMTFKGQWKASCPWECPETFRFMCAWKGSYGFQLRHIKQSESEMDQIAQVVGLIECYVDHTSKTLDAPWG